MRETSHDLVAAKADRLKRLAEKAGVEEGRDFGASSSVNDDTDEDVEPVRSEVFRAWNN